jgi:SAM-dependent methyltransferase
MSAAEDAAAQRIEADAREDTESALGEDESTYTQSLRSSLLESLRENGRGYHKYRDGQYILPEDEREQERLDMQHAMFLRSFQNRLYLAPVEETIHEALDLGTGTGIWAIDFADQHPQTNILGVDLSPIQPTWVPPNCKFEVDDFDAEWTYKTKFDFVHGRMLLTSSAGFPKLFQRAFDSLRPGGWFEMQDLYMPILCDDGSMDGTIYQKWNELYLQACLKLGRDPSWAAKYKDWMIQIGFDKVEEHVFKWPVNTWPKDRRLKEIGQWNMMNMLDGLEGFTVRLWTKALGMSVSEIEVFLAGVRQDLPNKKIHSYWKV